jgi:Alw26I/Eco31I/Esp3I family type II restriction m6 adenine DNA methyltransferase
MTPEASAKAIKAARGSYYTPEQIGRPLARSIVERLGVRHEVLRIIDPFGGDGRLLIWTLEEGVKLGYEGSWRIGIGELDEDARAAAESNVRGAVHALALDADVEVYEGDSLITHHQLGDGEWDAVVTNPPWETLKPDRRHQQELPDDVRAAYIDQLREYDARVCAAFPEAAPLRRFAGWGTNLSRPGLALSMKLVADDGVVGIVMPSSTFGDSIYTPLRERLARDFAVHEVNAFHAEDRHFAGMDQPFITILFSRGNGDSQVLTRVRRDAHRLGAPVETLNLRDESLRRADYRIPLTAASMSSSDQASLRELRTFDDLLQEGHFWAGRELDETRLASRLVPSRGTVVLKGRNVNRFSFEPLGVGRLDDAEVKSFATRLRPRLAWRDVSRPSQQRRIQAALIPAGPVTGNSLGVATHRDDDPVALYWLLGIISSIVFESMLRGALSTGHVTLASLRHVAVPDFEGTGSSDVQRVARSAESLAANPADLQAQAELELNVARAYGVSADLMRRLLESHDWIPRDDWSRILDQLPEARLA